MSYNPKLDTISVIIPTFNRCNLLKRAVSSVLTQTVKLDEVIVIDNGSSDQTDIMVSSSFPTIKYLVEKKRGVSAARNRGISFAQSNWIAFLDSDDTWKPNKIEKQLQLANQNKDLRLIHTNEIWYKNGKLLNQMKKHQKSGGNIFEKSLSNKYNIHRTRQNFENNGMDDFKSMSNKGISIINNVVLKTGGYISLDENSWYILNSNLDN